MTSISVTGFDTDTAKQIEMMLSHIEEEHFDTLFFVAEYISQDQAFDDLAKIEVSPDGLQFTLKHRDELFEAEATLSGEITDYQTLQGEVFGLLINAREHSPDAPLTSIELELQESSKIRTWNATVTERTAIAKNLMQVSLVCSPKVPTAGLNEFFQLLIPSPQHPDATPAGVEFSFIESLPPEARPHGAYYTTRRRCEITRDQLKVIPKWANDEESFTQIDFWVFLHGQDPKTISSWARQVHSGEEVMLWGPRGRFSPPETATEYVLICDETGLPACLSITEGSPDTKITLICKLQDQQSKPILPDHPNLTVHWVLTKNTGEQDSNRYELVETVKQITFDQSSTFFFGGAESKEITAVRKYLRNTRGLSAKQVHVSGYWRSN